MIIDSITKLFNSNEKTRRIKALERCKTRKCGKLNTKELLNASKHLRKEQDTLCPETASNGFNDNDCLDKVYLKSKFSRLIRKHAKCTKKKCSKEMNTLKKGREFPF